MEKKTLFVNRVKPLADGQNGEKRFSLYENGEHFCIAVAPKDDTERAAEIQALKGKEVIAVERSIETADGTQATQWYLLTEEAVDTYAAREASRDVNVLIASKKEVMAAQRTVTLAEAIKKAGATAMVA